MNKRLEWFLLILLAAGGICLWCRYSLPRFQSIDLSINQSKAVEIANQFLKGQRKVDISSFKNAVTFEVDEATDRYLQKTLGVTGSQQLIKSLHYDMFCWVIRYFKEKQKEEYKIAVSSATGEVIGFNHIIEDTAFRPLEDKEKERQIALDFLGTNFFFNPDQWITHGEDVKKFDHRQDYSFSWQRKDVDVPWGQAPEKSHAKLLSSVSISGDEILSFNKYQFDIPDAFNRYVENLKQTGQNLSLLFRILYLTLLVLSVVVVVNSRQQVVARLVKPFYIWIGSGIFVLMIADVLNNYQNLLYDYPTTQSLGDYIVRQLIEGIIGPLFIAVAFVLPALAGETLRFEVSSTAKNRGLLNTLLSTFCSIRIAYQILIGYLAAAVILGAQAVIYHFGFKYCGVWDELAWLTQASTSFFPAFTALAIGFQASFSEEAMFRLYAINLFKKYKVPTLLAVLLSAMIWGFGHTGYEIFPMWFRGLEVTCIGIIMGMFYFRFGLVCVLAAHFLIDSFLSSLPYLLHPGASFDFYSSLAVVLLPLLLALIAIIFNKNVQEKPLRVCFNPQQQFNFSLVKELSRHKTPEELIILKKDLQRYGWDAAIIQRVFDEET